jgi:hypothetical protein
VGNLALIKFLAVIDALLNDATTVPVVTLVEADGDVIILVTEPLKLALGLNM